MLRSANEVRGYVLQAADGEIGRCRDFLFDEKQWTIRYMVADTGKWLPGRKVLISPIALGEPDWTARGLPVQLSRAEIEEAPGLDADAPVSRQFELKYHAHYRWPPYWVGAGLWGAGEFPGPLYVQGLQGGTAPFDDEEADPFLRSVDELVGYRIQAADGPIGHVEDFILDDRNWTIRYLVVDTRNWLPGRKVLVAHRWVQSVAWNDRTVSAALSREEIRNSPEYDPSAPVNRQYEERLYDFYGRPRYWV